MAIEHSIITVRVPVFVEDLYKSSGHLYKNVYRTSDFIPRNRSGIINNVISSIRQSRMVHPVRNNQIDHCAYR